MPTNELRCGFAKSLITPPLNIPMAGYGRRKSCPTGVHDDLFARALILDNGQKRTGLVICDLVGLTEELDRKIRAAVAKAAQVEQKNLIIACTHTHAGPCTTLNPDLSGDPEVHKTYLAELPALVAKAAQEAAANLFVCRPVWGRAVETDIQHNRRIHLRDGTRVHDWDDYAEADVFYHNPVDPDLQVLAFLDKRGKVRGVVSSFACHATVLDHTNMEITGDWPGAYCSYGEKQIPDSVWIMAQGACGDINPTIPRDDFAACNAKAKKLAQAALRALEHAEPIRGSEIDAATVSMILPGKKGTLSEREAASVQVIPQGTRGTFWPTNLTGHPDVPITLNALRIGDVCLMGIPGEVFSQIGIRIKALSEFRGTLIIGYSTKYETSYIPVAPEYPFGGYEIDVTCVAPGGDDILINGARKVMEKLARSPKQKALAAKR